MAYAYDYFISDHLGNVRTVLTEQQLVNKYPAATLEDSRVATEKNYYEIDDGRRVAKNLTGATQSSFEDKLYRTNGGTNEKTGLGITLKVMAGDQVYIKAESFYQKPSGSLGNPLPLLLTELANAFIGTPVIAASGKSISEGTISSAPGSASLSDFLNNNRTQPDGQTPRAYVNWVLFDEQFRFVTGGTDPVNSNGGYKLHDAFISSPVQITKNGYLFVYCSNESNLNVFFDNLQLTHVQGHLQQEDTYYPYGMGIAALSSQAANGLQNGFKYNGISEEDNFDLGLYDAYYRTLDPQIGRWWQIDPANQFASPYLSMGNNPVNYIDPEGDFILNIDPGILIQLTKDLFSGGQLPEVVIKASRIPFGEMLMHFATNDFVNIASSSNLLFHVSRLSQLQGPIQPNNYPGLNPSNALFTHYETPDDKARQAFVDYYKDVDFEHGQLMQPRSSFWDFFGSRKALNGLYVGADGYPLPFEQQAIQRQADYDVALFSMIDVLGELELPLQFHHFATNKNKFWTPG